MKPLSRRDFLKLSGLLPLSLAAFNGAPRLQDGRPNILVVVFDAFSAHNMSLYGYSRKTTPNIDRLASRAIVYHNHYATSSFTTPGTASILTGVYPWRHRANKLKSTVDERFVSRNLFSLFQDYYRIAYTHNPWADIFLEQFQSDLEEWVPLKSLFLRSQPTLVQSIFQKDADIAGVSWTRDMDLASGGYAYSLFLSHLYAAIQRGDNAELQQLFPRGLPRQDSLGTEFLPETAIDWTAGRLAEISDPFLAYFHFLPPHDPYTPSARFLGSFAGDGFRPPEKPEDIFSRDVSINTLRIERRLYDEFILYVDDLFNQLYGMLESSGLLENTWIVLTSDHGEMHERGIMGHGIGPLYEPQIHIPLVIFEPGRTTRQDVHSLTSSVDLLPSLALLAGGPMPDWGEGIVLPGLADAETASSRNVYSIRATRDREDGPLLNSTTALIKDRYKLISGFGHEGQAGSEFIRLYDLKEDPEELQDISTSKPEIASGLLKEMKLKLDEVNAPYM